MNIKPIIFTLACALICTAAHAATNAATNAGRMHVQISNETSTACRLTSQNLLHGIFTSAPPQSIMANDSKIFDME